MLKCMRALQKCCFPLPSRERELREIEQIHNELNQRLSRGERARLQCLMDKTESLRRLTAEDHFAAGVALGWYLREELQREGILPLGSHLQNKTSESAPLKQNKNWR